MAPGKKKAPQKQPFDKLEYRSRKVKYLNHISDLFARNFFGFDGKNLDKTVRRFVYMSLGADEARKSIIEGEIKLPSQIQKEHEKKLELHPLYRFDPHWIYPLTPEVTEWEIEKNKLPSEKLKAERKEKNETSWTVKLLDEISTTREESIGFRINECIEADFPSMEWLLCISSLAEEHQKKFKLQFNDVYDLSDAIEELQRPIIKVLVQKLILISAKKQRERIKKAAKKLPIVKRL